MGITRQGVHNQDGIAFVRIQFPISFIGECHRAQCGTVFKGHFLRGLGKCEESFLHNPNRYAVFVMFYIFTHIGFDAPMK